MGVPLAGANQSQADQLSSLAEGRVSPSNKNDSACPPQVERNEDKTKSNLTCRSSDWLGYRHCFRFS
eukprot:1159660-Pelagomonas_calceolata.AAC.2